MSRTPSGVPEIAEIANKHSTPKAVRHQSGPESIASGPPRNVIDLISQRKNKLAFMPEWQLKVYQAWHHISSMLSTSRWRSSSLARRQ